MKEESTQCPSCGELRGFFRWCDSPTRADRCCVHGQFQAHGFMLCADCGTAWGKEGKEQEHNVSIAFVAIDPGIVTGAAVWTSRLDTMPVATATFRRNAGTTFRSWLIDSQYVAFQLMEWLRRYQFQNDALGFVEEPAFFDTSGGHMVARRGDFCKLAMIAGMEISTLVQLGIAPRLVGIQNWKGQLPKAIVRDRIREVLGESFTGSEHEWDAIGIGLAARGMLDL